MSAGKVLADLYKKKDKLEKYIAELEGETGLYEPETMQLVVERVRKRPPLKKFSTGIDWLDEKMNGGLSEATFINLAGENFGGKTYLTMKIMEHISKTDPVFFFSFEMYEGLLAKRVAHWSNKQLNNLFIEQKITDLYRIESIIRSQRERGIKFFAIDSRMKITLPYKMDIYEKNSEITKVLSKVTQEIGATILLINQIAETDLRNGRLSLKGSGDQTYDSDVIIYIAIERDKKTKEPKARHYICTKDRINERTWKHIEPIVNEQPKEIEYSEKEIDEVDIPEI